MFLVIPNDLGDEIDRQLDAEIAKTPDAAKDREHLRSQLIAFFNEHGYLPDFSIQGPKP